MSSKKVDVSRRTFVRRAGLLVSSLGVGASVQSGLLDSIVRKANSKWGIGEAMAAEAGVVNYVVEICFRAGFQFNSLFASAGHARPIGERSSVLNFYSSPGNVVAYTPSGDAKARPVYFSRYTAGAGADRLRQVVSDVNGTGKNLGVATSEGIKLFNSQHTDNFFTRAPNANAPSPAVLHAARGPEVPVRAVVFDSSPAGAFTHQNASLPSITGNKIKTKEDYIDLYRNVPMYFTMDELKLVLGEIENGNAVTSGAIGALDQLYLARGVSGSQEMAQVSLQGRGQAQLDIANRVRARYDSVAPGFGANVDQGFPKFTLSTFDGFTGGIALRSSLAASLSGFAEGVLSTSVVCMDSEDWHTNIPALDSTASKQARWNEYIGDALASFLSAAAQIDDPLSPGKKIVESLLISLSSEFTRTPLRQAGGGDNGDGGTQAFAFLGSKVRSGSFGDISPGGTIFGFDPVTGAPVSGGANLTEAQVWKTAGKMMGFSDTTLAMYAPQSAIDVLVKS